MKGTNEKACLTMIATAATAILAYKLFLKLTEEKQTNGNP